MSRDGYPGPRGEPGAPPSSGSSVRPGDWHAQRYAAGEALVKAARAIVADYEIHPLWLTEEQRCAARALRRALAEFDRVKDAP